MTAILLLALGVIAVAAAGSGGKTPQRTPTPTPTPTPPPGPAPNPESPNDPDTGAYYVSYGIPFDDSQASVREATILQLAGNAKGTLHIDGLVRDENTPKRCVPLSWRLTVKDGDIVDALVVAAKRSCGAGSITLKATPLQYDGPSVTWYSQGGAVVMRFETKGRGLGVSEDDAPWYSPEDYGSTTLGVDLRWRFD